MHTGKPSRQCAAEQRHPDVVLEQRENNMHTSVYDTVEKLIAFSSL